MTHRRLCIITGLLLMGTAECCLAKPCPVTPVNVAISPTYTYGGTSASSLLFPDSSQAYVDGVDGVAAYINTGCTSDLIVDLNSSTRKTGFSFQNVASTNASTPSWTATPFRAAGAYLVVGNLMYNYAPNAYYQFTTTGQFMFSPPTTTSTGTNSQDVICFTNRLANVFKSCSTNQPYNTSLLVVTHSPADPMTGAVETWTITPDNTDMNPAGAPAFTQVGTLALNGHQGWVNAGQFSLPFQFTVTRK